LPETTVDSVTVDFQVATMKGVLQIMFAVPTGALVYSFQQSITIVP
jgi:hypothetical protein